MLWLDMSSRWSEAKSEDPLRPGTIFARSHGENRAGPPRPIIWARVTQLGEARITAPPFFHVTLGLAARLTSEMATYWNAQAPAANTRGIPMSFVSWKIGRLLVVVLVIVVGIAYYMHRGSGGAKYMSPRPPPRAISCGCHCQAPSIRSSRCRLAATFPAPSRRCFATSIPRSPRASCAPKSTREPIKTPSIRRKRISPMRSQYHTRMRRRSSTIKLLSSATRN